MHSILVGTAVIAAFFAGVVALFAPCCVSVMLPAYLASGAHRRRGLITMTFVFAAGVSTVILPIAFGANVLSRAINGEHSIVYSVMAMGMIAMGLAMVAGYRLPIPMPGGRARGRPGVDPRARCVLGGGDRLLRPCASRGRRTIGRG
ncbi:MAG: cytochrome c biogenesis CcdA family protein [Acidimicrobiales bacterium]